MQYFYACGLPQIKIKEPLLQLYEILSVKQMFSTWLFTEKFFTNQI